MSRYLPYLRIAFSITCGIACALLVVLWIYTRDYAVGVAGPLPGSTLKVAAMARHGGIGIALSTEAGDTQWITYSVPPERNIDLPYKTVAGFVEYLKLPNIFRIRLPIWSFLILFSSLGMLPWIRWSKHFSLRTLLIAMTLIAMVLGLAVWAAK